MRTLILQIGRIWNCKRGFSFLEILIVLVIMSLIMSIVIPNFNKMFASVEGVREGGKMMHLLEKMRAEAILKAESQDITFYTNGQCTFFLDGRLMEYEDLRLSVILDEEEADHVIQTFDPDGTALHSVLYFQTVQGKFITYRFNPINGKIEMERSSEL